MFKSHHFYRLTLIRGVYVLCTYKTLLKIYFRNGFIKSEANFYLLRLNSSTLSLNLYTEHRFCVSFVRPSKAEIEATQQSFSFCWNWWRQFFSFAKALTTTKNVKSYKKKLRYRFCFVGCRMINLSKRQKRKSATTRQHTKNCFYEKYSVLCGLAM